MRWRWSYILMGAVVLTALTINSYRLFSLNKGTTNAIIVGLVVIITISLFGVMSRLRE